MSLLYYIQAKIFLSKGNLDEALSAILNSIKLDEEIVQEDNLNILSKLLQAKIYNYLKDYTKSYDIAEQLYQDYQINPNNGENNDLLARILIELSRANLGLGEKELALEQVKLAKDVLLFNKDRGNDETISLSHDIYLAAVFVTEGDVLSALKQFKKAVKSYEIAEKIFYNKYRDNISNNFEISYLYFNVALACYLAGDLDKFSIFKTRHLNRFGTKHPKTIELLNMKIN